MDVRRARRGTAMNLRPNIHVPARALCIALLLATSALASAREPIATTVAAVPAHGIIGVEERHLDPGHWIRLLGADAERPYLDADAIAAHNARLLAEDDSVRDMAEFPLEVDGAQVRAWIEALSERPTAERYDVEGKPVERGFFDTLERDMALDAIPDRVQPRFGLAVDRADLRAFPTTRRIFSTAGDVDIDRLQESGLFPGDALAVLHTTADGSWSFVASDRYLAWMETSRLATGTREQTAAYRNRTPSLLVTGATARTVFNPVRPDISELQLDMGVRVPVLADWPADGQVHGQHPAFGHVIELPARRADGSLEFVPALLPRTAEVAAEPLPLTPANLIRQGFRFLGERYGWGHSFNARDCSGFVSEIYRSMGVQLPRNTRDQAVSPAFDKTVLSAESTREERLAAVADMQVGDLIYIPGHVMMMIGRDNGMTYVIHDTSGTGYRGADGDYVRMSLSGVVVTALEPMMSGRETDTIDRITSIVRIR
ncbi:NlpC-P60 family protein [Luteimonas yindakuii]|uniref:NlpC-P60 family protein n=2 Tax=Luteimonas yindakuii TaxID=2565782 RepID=A0A4Z1RKG2_9GAMM|nr:NlpC-P60 family protein [Luteimonas yindakuii]